jgi:6-phosphogluconate dehydrogenase
LQIICEAYQLLSEGLGLPADEIQAIFAEWNKGVLDSYLIEITTNILGFKDEDGEPLELAALFAMHLYFHQA